MKFFNESLNKVCAYSRNCVYGVVYISEKYIELGYFNRNAGMCLVYATHQYLWAIDVNIIPDYYVYNNNTGAYCDKQAAQPYNILKKGIGEFPYCIDREYSANKSLHLYKDKQKINNYSDYSEIAKYLKYTFGLEFETSMGYIPQYKCFEDGLIPLRDGSISGIEYSTIILSGNSGLNLIKQSIEDLNKYTEFNKECSLHIHFGNFPISEISIYVLYKLFNSFQYEIDEFIPKFSYETNKYKKNLKSYCSPLPQFNSFNELYEYLSMGHKYSGSLTTPHNEDIFKERKWLINTRYHNINLINACFYESNKTIEFRFLRPTNSYLKIFTWIFILNGLLSLAEKISCNFKNISDCENNINEYIDAGTVFNDILNLYPKEISSLIAENTAKMIAVKNMQEINADYCGRDVSIENKLFNVVL